MPHKQKLRPEEKVRRRQQVPYCTLSFPSQNSANRKASSRTISLCGYKQERSRIPNGTYGFLGCRLINYRLASYPIDS